MDTIDFPRFILAFVFILGLIGLLGVFLKRYGKSLPGKAGAGNRLGVIETVYIDSRRKLVLVKRDNTEHLLLLADGRELVIESNITGGMMDDQQPAPPGTNA